MPDWSEMFALTTPLLEIFLRGTVVFLVLFALLRIAGKRESGAHSLTDLLVVVLIAQAASGGMAGDSAAITDSLILAATVLFWSVALDALAWRWPALGRLIKPRGSLLVTDGRANKHALRREFMTWDELMTELRLHGISDVSEVRRAYLEPNGMVSVIRMDEKAPSDEPPKPPTFG